MPPLVWGFPPVLVHFLVLQPTDQHLHGGDPDHNPVGLPVQLSKNWHIKADARVLTAGTFASLPMGLRHPFRGFLLDGRPRFSQWVHGNPGNLIGSDLFGESNLNI